MIKDTPKEVEDFGKTTLYNAAQAALRLGVEESSVRRIAIRMNAEGIQVGRKLNARAWLFTEADITRMSEREDRRGDWQKEGGRRRYLSKKKYQEEQARMRHPTA